MPISRSKQSKLESRGWFSHFIRDERGFAGAEAALLAVILCGICIVVGGILQRAAVQAAQSLNTELAGGR